MSKIKVLFTFKPWTELQNYFEEKLSAETNLQLIFPPDDDNNIIMEMARDADILFGWRPTLELLEAATKMKVYINPGTGVERLIPVFRQYSRKNDILFLNGHGHSYDTAQHAVALLFSLTNKIILHHLMMKEGKWRVRDPLSIHLRNKKIGLLGYGAINKKVHQFLSGMEVEFHILKRRLSKINSQIDSPLNQYGPDQLEEFLINIDILMIAIPLTVKTENLIGKHELKLLGECGLLINVGRGKIINQQALFNALQNNIIQGAAIDTWYNYDPDEINGKKYPYSVNYPFHELDNIILSPHRAASPSSHISRWDEHIENMKKFAQGSLELDNIVNLEDEY